MPTPKRFRPDNAFLAALSDREREALQPLLSTVHLKQGAVLYSSGERIRRLWFPQGAVVSFAVALSHGDTVEFAMVGRESVVGASATFEGMAFCNAIVQFGGPSATIEIQALRKATRAVEAVRDLLPRHERYLLLQAQQSAACIATHLVAERLCSRLMRARDLAESEMLPLTQDYLARMLGVRRTSIALAVKRLNAAGMIDHRRSRIRIVDAAALKAAACECYETIKNQAAGILAPRPGV